MALSQQLEEAIGSKQARVRRPPLPPSLPACDVAASALQAEADEARAEGYARGCAETTAALLGGGGGEGKVTASSAERSSSAERAPPAGGVERGRALASGDDWPRHPGSAPHEATDAGEGSGRPPDAAPRRRPSQRRDGTASHKEDGPGQRRESAAREVAAAVELGRREAAAGRVEPAAHEPERGSAREPSLPTGREWEARLQARRAFEATRPSHASGGSRTASGVGRGSPATASRLVGALKQALDEGAGDEGEAVSEAPTVEFL